MNVLLIITDQQRKDHLHCYGNELIKTPNIDNILLEGGVAFTNYFCNNPICMPNRSCMFTGVLPSVHGTRSNGINLNPDIPVISEILRKNGYHTVSVGKLHFNFLGRPAVRGAKSMENIIAWLHGDIKSENFTLPYYGFDEVYLTAGHGDFMAGHYSEWLKEKGWDQHEYVLNQPLSLNEKYYETKMSEDLYPTTYIAEKTVEFLENYAKPKNSKEIEENVNESADQNLEGTLSEESNEPPKENADEINKSDEVDEPKKPFFLHVSFPDPHHPVCPPGKYKEMYNPEDIEKPSNFFDVLNLQKHEFIGQHIDGKFRQLFPQRATVDVFKQFIALTYGSITMIDDAVGKILNTLEKCGLKDKTMVIFASDHGDYGGAHGFVLKGPVHYRELINMPLIWRIPGRTEPAVCQSLICTIDIPKTILSLLGIDKKYNPKVFQGVDASILLKAQKEKVRDQILIEHDEEVDKDTIVRLRSLVTENYRLTLYDGYDTGDLFDLINDPKETTNLWHQNKILRNDLIQRMLREIISLRPRSPRRASYN